LLKKIFPIKDEIFLAQKNEKIKLTEKEDSLS